MKTFEYSEFLGGVPVRGQLSERFFLILQADARFGGLRCGVAIAGLCVCFEVVDLPFVDFSSDAAAADVVSLCMLCDFDQPVN